MENVNKQLLDALKEMVSIVEIHSEATNNNFAWAELSYAHEAIAAAEQAQQAEVVAADPAVAAIQFALETHSDGLRFLRLWNEGEFDLLRREWPEAPEDIYIGADPLLEVPAQPPAVAVSVPDGYALVPIEPTEEMIKEAAMYEWGRGDAEGITYAGLYRAMLATAQKGGAA